MRSFGPTSWIEPPPAPASEQGAGDRVGIGHQGAAEADHDHGGDQAGDAEHQDRTDGDDAEHHGSGTDRDPFGRELVDRIGPADGAAGVGVRDGNRHPERQTNRGQETSTRWRLGLCSDYALNASRRRFFNVRYKYLRMGRAARWARIPFRTLTAARDFGYAGPEPAQATGRADAEGSQKNRARPAPRIPIVDAVINLRQRLDYVTNVLGLRPAVVSLTSKMSERLLRDFNGDDWNPHLYTLIKLDETLDQYLPRWIADHERRRS